MDYKNCICRKSIVDKLVDECINVVDEDIQYNKTLSIDPNDCPSRTPYIVLFVIFLLISLVGASIFACYWRYKKKEDKNTFVYVQYSNTGPIIY